MEINYMTTKNYFPKLFIIDCEKYVGQYVTTSFDTEKHNSLLDELMKLLPSERNRFLTYLWLTIFLDQSLFYAYRKKFVLKDQFYIPMLVGSKVAPEMLNLLPILGAGVNAWHLLYKNMSHVINWKINEQYIIDIADIFHEFILTEKITMSEMIDKMKNDPDNSPSSPLFIMIMNALEKLNS